MCTFPPEDQSVGNSKVSVYKDDSIQLAHVALEDAPTLSLEQVIQENADSFYLFLGPGNERR